jgi:FtsH-binding integral membrane protein
MMYATTIDSYRDAAGVNQAMGRVYGHMALAVLTSMLVSMLCGYEPRNG